MHKEINPARFGRILLVDDTTANLQLLTNLLTEQGYIVHPASDGKLALEFVRTTLPDLILLDIRMPGMDGYEVCRRLKADERTRSIPLIFISILEDEHDKVRGFQEGAVDYITKPFQPEEVLARVQTHLRLRELTEHLGHRVAERTEELMIAKERLQQELAERVRAEAALKRERTLIANITETSPIGIITVGVNGRITFANTQAINILGLTKEEITQRTYNTPDWRITDFAGNPFPYEKLPFRQVMTTGQSIYDEQHTIAWPDGRRVHLSINGAPLLNESGDVESVVFAFQDISQRKRAERALQESEAKMRSILDNIGIGVALISPKMEILELNRRMHQWFSGIDPGQHPICYQAFNDPPREEVCDYCPTCKTLRDGLVHEATTQTPQPGGTRNYRVISSPILNQSGQVTAAIEMVEDITEKLSLESQLHQAQKMESVGRLAGGVAHDFNNMLGVIIGHAELTLDQMDPTHPLFASMQEIRKAAVRSADLTRQLLAFARKQTVAPKVLDLNETVEGMFKMLRRLIGEDINLVWLPDSDLWPVKMDPSQIDQILANLCVNARDAIVGVGKVTIETHTITFDEACCAEHPGFMPGDFVMLAVSDDGKGMDQETLDKIFEPFFTTKGTGRGTGLGLATVYGVVKQNNGFINVYSEPGQGSTIKIYLPR
ncbi:MAG: response regulator, partial [Deltaproteobacteria bacterium]|nr:response regulator [Deltaproteobacteria bacterium]